MSNLVGREGEFRLLGALLDEVRDNDTDQRGRALLMRGRRRVGKSRLLEEFCQRSRAPWAFLTATEGEAPGLQRAEFGHVIATESDLPHRDEFTEATFPTWTAFLRQLATILPDDKPSIVVLDELPYLAAADASFEGALQTAWDRYLSRKPVLFIGVGSDLTMMKLLAEYGHPFHQRAQEMVLRPLSPMAVGKLAGLAPAEAFDAFLITGGFPLICRQWRRGEGPRDFLKRAFADPVSALLVSGERLLASEFPTEVQARRVLSIIGGTGARTFSAIADAAGDGIRPMAATALTRALDVLTTKGLISIESPLSTKAAPRDKRYEVIDPYLRFWLTFIQPSMPLIERGSSDVVLRHWQERWPGWRGAAVEPVVRESVARLLSATPWPAAVAVGAWWPRTNNPQLDIVVADRGPIAQTVHAVGSVKWRERVAFTDRDFAALSRDAVAVPGVTTTTGLVAVARTDITADGLAAAWTASDLIEAWR